MMQRIKNHALSLFRDSSGHFAIWTGLMALPMLAATTFVIDYHSAQQKKTDLKAALDAAALATVTNQKLDEAGKKAYAATYFSNNFADANNFELLVTSPGPDRVDLEAKGTVPVSVSAAIGIDDIAIAESSSAVLTREHIICVLTLNPDGAESFALYIGALFNSPNCAVQVNSTHEEAAYVDRSSTAIAKDFCVTGGASGNFIPFANTECAPVADPYANKVPPMPGSCKDLSAYRGKGKNAPAVIGDNVVLTPGTYCEGLTIDGTNVTLTPGTYIMDGGEIWFRQGSEARAEDVTIVLRGPDSTVFVEQGSKLYIKAPSTGNYAGLAIFQDAEETLKSTKWLPSAITTLTGGSEMTIVGTVYVPTQRIDIWGNSQYSNTSPATSYIGYDVSLGKNSTLAVNVDHAKAGLPPILPRSDEGARLVK